MHMRSLSKAGKFHNSYNNNLGEYIYECMCDEVVRRYVRDLRIIRQLTENNQRLNFSDILWLQESKDQEMR